MELTRETTIRVVACLLLLAAITQSIYTGIYVAHEAGIADFEPPRQLLWGGEGLLFTILAAFAGSALVEAKRYTLGFSAIAMSAVLNVVQVGVGLTQFGPFREVAEASPEVAPLAGSVVAYSFFGYNAAKVLLGLAALVFGMAKMAASDARGAKVLGGLTALVGLVAMISNAVVMSFGLGMSMTGGGVMPSGASGVLATVLLAVCLFGEKGED